MRITVVGAGAIGCLISGILALYKADVTLFTRRESVARVINSYGIKIVKPDGSSTTSNPKCIYDSDELRETELAIITVKAYETRQIANLLAKKIPRECYILTIQNGFNNLEEIGRAVCLDRVLGGVTTQAATLIEDNTVFHAYDGETIIGKHRLSKINNELVKHIASFLTQHGVRTRESMDIEVEIWVKGLLNCVINPLTALLNIRNGELMKLDNIKEIVEHIVSEGILVGKKVGITIDKQKVVDLVFEVIGKTAANKSSMLQDIEKGRKTEIEQLNGWIVEKAREFNIKTPINTLLTSMVKLKTRIIT